MSSPGQQPTGATPATTIYFVSCRTSGASRRMDSLIAQLQMRERRRAIVRRVDLDADAGATLAERLGVTEVPALVLVKDGRILGRLSGRATMPQIDRFVSPHLEP